VIKPLLYRMVPQQVYFWLHCYGKRRDIRLRLVEEREMDLLPDFVRPGDEVIDLGANYAYYSARMSNLVGAAGRVYAFEPIPSTSRVFKHLIASLKIENVELVEKGAGARSERVVFRVPLQDFGAPSAGIAHIGTRNNDLPGRDQCYAFNRHRDVACDVVAIDEFLLPRLSRLSFIKIDIEGAEYFALQGMRKTLEKFKPVVLVEIQPFFLKGFGISEEQMQGLIRDLGYEMFAYDQLSHRLTPFRGHLPDFNYFLIHRSAVDRYPHLVH
jgi:FkbM family methyltransferase